MQSNINNECSIKFVLNYRELKANSISICVLKYRILHKFKENIKVLKFNSKSFSHDAQHYKTSTLLELKHIFVCLLVFFFFFFLATQQGMWNLSSLTRVRTCVHCIGSSEP